MNKSMVIQKWGNSSAVRLPSQLLAVAGFSPGQEVKIFATNGRLEIRPVVKKKTLAELLSQINPSNYHPVEDWGEDLGLEAEWQTQKETQEQNPSRPTLQVVET